MKTLENYVESVFIDLPSTPQLDALKEEILSNMEEKYLHIRESGVDEAEAIGIVISEFGNIDDIIDEYDIPIETKQTSSKDTLLLNAAKAEEYLVHRNQFAFGISFGVFLCILSIPLLLITGSLLSWIFPAIHEEALSLLAVSLFLLTIASGVGLFIIFGIRESHYPYANKQLKIDKQSYLSIQTEYKQFTIRFPYAIAAGVVLCISGVVALLLTSIFLAPENLIGVAFLLSFIATGVFLFVFFGIQKDTYEKLLTKGTHSPAQFHSRKVTDRVASVVFPLATFYYLFQGFVNGQWATAWIVFPLVGVGFGIFAAITEALANSKFK